VLKVPIDRLETELSGLKSEGNHIDLKIFGLAELAKKFL
jgi:hypothetical protein